MTSSTITIRTDPEIAKQITALAKAMERSRNWVIEDALKHYIEEQAWQVEGIRDAMMALDQGEGIAHEDVMVEMEALIEAKIRAHEGRT
ncbi:CopG domain protein DNA-binding domain protein [Nitrosococcus halophilus Nc 4]|uniref:CopG domain protein DNA-binding domain protein n=1 Tax=Nitrosococcus halophilus (strain Nc4) TaxID=472759 RepID=D5BY15_NITHN|nr:ribbon-helix-helix protein, CopG family [Nitrosococcus halophilus]ADE15926.1 CopG domain protein DNA-binding domain protein [Nitrosococcus halophilus Nc 4]